MNENAWALTRPPATCPPCQYSCPIDLLTQTVNVHYTSRRDAMWCYDVTWPHDIMVWRHMTSFVMSTWCRNKCRNFTFSNMATLTFDLDLDLIQDIMKVHTSIKFWVRTSNYSAVQTVQRWQTHTHRRDRFHTLNRWRGREKVQSRSQEQIYSMITKESMHS